MPQSSPDRTDLGNFLPQFADPAQQPAAVTLNGDGAAHDDEAVRDFQIAVNRLNGHSTAIENGPQLERENGRFDDAEILIEPFENGHVAKAANQADALADQIGLNGHGDVHINGNGKYVSALDPVADAVRASETIAASPAVAAPLARTPIDELADKIAPPIAEPTAVIEPQASPSDEPAEGSLPTGQSSRGDHPACGSLFTPYLVTEIRELRNRCKRRKGWFRRLFG